MGEDPLKAAAIVMIVMGMNTLYKGAEFLQPGDVQTQNLLSCRRPRDCQCHRLVDRLVRLHRSIGRHSAAVAALHASFAGTAPLFAKNRQGVYLFRLSLVAEFRSGVRPPAESPDERILMAEFLGLLSPLPLERA